MQMKNKMDLAVVLTSTSVVYGKKVVIRQHMSTSMRYVLSVSFVAPRM